MNKKLHYEPVPAWVPAPPKSSAWEWNYTLMLVFHADADTWATATKEELESIMNDPQSEVRPHAVMMALGYRTNN